jgi:DNA end-binding protein Ku
MAPRPTWKGYLRLSLVSCPIRLYPATTRSERVSFHLLNPKTKNRIEMRTHDAETGEEIPRDTLLRGYEFDKGRYVVVDDAELDALRIESSETIDLVRFVDETEIDPIFHNAPYYVAPEGKIANETFRVIQEAMRQAGKAGIGRVVLSSREHAVALSPRHRGMLMMTLRSPEEVREDTEYFADIEDVPLDEEMVDMARRIIDQKSGTFVPEELTGDRYQIALRELIVRKIHGQKPPAAQAAPGPSNVVNLMDALKRSLADEERKAPAPSRKQRGGAAKEEPAARAAPAKRRRSEK